MPHQQARDYSTAKIAFDVMPNTRLLQRAKLYQNIRRKGRVQTHPRDESLGERWSGYL
jgi:hypothetical protein